MLPEPLPHGGAAVPFFGSFTLFGTAGAMFQASGLSWPVAAALFGGVGTFLIGLVNVSREVRAWRRQEDAR